MSTATCGSAGAWATRSSTACAVFTPGGKPIGHIALPERCANLCFGGRYRNRLFMAASHVALFALREHAGRGRRLKKKNMGGIDSRYAWWRLAASVAISTLGGVGMWSIVVALPVVQSDLGVSRAEISFAYTTTMLGFCVGGVVMGRLVDSRVSCRRSC